jgi:hypothetical protein
MAEGSNNNVLMSLCVEVCDFVWFIFSFSKPNLTSKCKEHEEECTHLKNYKEGQCVEYCMCTAYLRTVSRNEAF